MQIYHAFKKSNYMGPLCLLSWLETCNVVNIIQSACILTAYCILPQKYPVIGLVPYIIVSLPYTLTLPYQALIGCKS